MIHNLLSEYRSYLETKYSKETARTYADRLCALLDGQSLTETINKLDMDKIMAKLATVKYKNHFSQNKNALFHFCEFKNISLSADALERIKVLEENTHKKYRKLKAVDYREIDRKIKYIRNKKLKLSYQTIIATGLRVSELSSLTPAGCAITDDEITFRFIAKGGNMARVTLKRTDDSLLFGRLKEHIENTKQDDKVFYSAIHLQTKAKEFGFTCHDLRRVCAKLEYKKSKSKEAVKEKLRHSSMKNTNIYLKSKVKL